jgi:hypothetical protein
LKFKNARDKAVHVRDFTVGTTADVVSELHNGDLGTETTPDRTL